MEEQSTTGNGWNKEKSEDVPLESFLAYQIAYLLWDYVPPIIVILGTFGNVTTIVVMHKMTSERDSTINLMFTALAITDLITIYVTSFSEWLNISRGLHFGTLSRFTCKIYYWLNTATATMSSWILVSLTAHRALSVMWPHRVNVICTRREVLVTICLIVGLFAGLYSHYIYGYDLVVRPNSTTPECAMTLPEHIQFTANIFTIIDLLLFALLPFGCLVACNGVLVWKLTQSVREARRHLTSGNTQQIQSRTKTASSVTLTVIVVSLTYVLLYLPCGVLFVMFYAVRFNFESVSNEEYASVFLYTQVSLLMAYANSAVNFYLYCLTGRKFRQVFLHLLTCGKSGEKNLKNVTTT